MVQCQAPFFRENTLCQPNCGVCSHLSRECDTWDISRMIWKVDVRELKVWDILRIERIVEKLSIVRVARWYSEVE